MPKLPIGDIGPAMAVWDYDEAGETELGATLGTTELKTEDSVSEVFEEAYGDAPVDGVFAGTKNELTIPFTRQTLDNLEKVLPGSVLTGDGLVISNKCGSDMYASAVALCLKPIKDLVVSTDEKEWVLFYKVYPYKAYSIGFDRSGQRVFVVKFKVFPNQESGFEGEFYSIGVDTP
jgi:hypothetical protein